MDELKFITNLGYCTYPMNNLVIADFGVNTIIVGCGLRMIFKFDEIAL